MPHHFSAKEWRIHTTHSPARGGYYSEVFTSHGRLLYTTQAHKEKLQAREEAVAWVKANKGKI